MPKPVAFRSDASCALGGALLLAVLGIAVSACADTAPLTPEQQHYLDIDRERFPIGVYHGFG